MRMNKTLFFCGVSTTVLMLNLALCNSAIASSSEWTVKGIDNTYYIPHVYLSGYGGTNLLGDVDVLLPLYIKTDRDFYIYGAGSYAGAEESDQNNSWSAVFGTGYRQMVTSNDDKKRIYGLYLLGSYDYSSYGNEFWVINPGVESLGERWDFRMNIYMPVGDHNFSYQDFASNHGDDSHVDAHDHETDDMLVTYYENVGYGADAEAGGRLFSISHMPVKGYIDGYYYHVDNDNMTSDLQDIESTEIFGVGGRVTFQPTRYLTLELKDVYDNERKNLFELGAKVYLNGFRDGVGETSIHVDDQNLQDRLFENIEHNFGTIDSSATSFVNQGNTDNSSDNPIVPIEVDQVFFSADVENGGDGTAENPYPASDLDQTTINESYAAWDDVQFVLASGSESAYEPGSIELYDGTSIVGKNSDYSALAEGSDRPTIYGSLTLDGDNTLDSIILLNDNSSASVGITVESNAKKVLIDNITIGSTYYDSKISYSTGIDVKSNAQVTINNSEINSYVDDFTNDGVDSIGINAYHADVTVSNSTINALFRSNGSEWENSSIGINAYASTLNLEKTTVLAYNTEGFACGLAIDGGSANITGGSILAETVQAHPGDDAFEIAGVLGTDTTINVNGGAQVGALLSGMEYGDTASAYSYGIYVQGNSTLVVNSAGVSSTLYDGIDAVGIYVGDGSTLELSGNSTIDVAAYYAIGVRVADGANAYVSGSGEIDIDFTYDSGQYVFGFWVEDGGLLTFTPGNYEVDMTNEATTAADSVGVYSASPTGVNGYSDTLIIDTGFMHNYEW